MPKQIFKLAGLTCSACKKVSEKRLGNIGGVNSVDVSLSTNLATIDVDRVLAVAEINEVLKDTPYRALEK